MMSFKNIYKIVVLVTVVIPTCSGAEYVDYVRTHAPEQLAEDVYSYSLVGSLLQDIRKCVNQGSPIPTDTYAGAFRVQQDGTFLVVQADPTSQITKGQVYTAGQMLYKFIRETLAKTAIYSMGALGVVNKSHWTMDAIGLQSCKTLDPIQLQGPGSITDLEKYKIFKRIYAQAARYTSDPVFIAWVQTLNWGSMVETYEYPYQEGQLQLTDPNGGSSRHLIPQVMLAINEKNPGAVAEEINRRVGEIVTETDIAINMSRPSTVSPEIEDKLTAICAAAHSIQQVDPEQLQSYKKAGSLPYDRDKPFQVDPLEQLRKALADLRTQWREYISDGSSPSVLKWIDSLDTDLRVFRRWASESQMSPQEGSPRLSEYGSANPAPSQQRLDMWRDGNLEGFDSWRKNSARPPACLGVTLDNLVAAAVGLRSSTIQWRQARTDGLDPAAPQLTGRAKQIGTLLAKYRQALEAVQPGWVWMMNGFRSHGGLPPLPGNSSPILQGITKSWDELEWPDFSRNVYGNLDAIGETRKDLADGLTLVQSLRTAGGYCFNEVAPLMLIGAREISWSETVLIEAFKEHSENIDAMLSSAVQSPDGGLCSSSRP
ncbi:MAG: hypothetical protein LBJ92_00825 [Holosporales bacterium]|jgi:hypothetical protein|nr:hypothetical protein [Holosporales bacterium]